MADVDYDDLGALWRDVADSLSGYVTDAIDPAILCSAWPHQPTSAAIVGGDIEVSLDTGAGIVVLAAPAPADTMQGYADVQAMTGFYRSGIMNWSGAAWPNGNRMENVTHARLWVISTAFSTVYKADKWVNIQLPSTMPSLVKVLLRSQTILLGTGPQDHSWDGTMWHSDSEWNWTLDFMTVATAFHETGYQISLDPPQEGMSEWLQWPGVDTPVPADPVEIAALNIYSDRMAAAAGRAAVTIQTHSSKTLVRQPSASGVTLDEATGTLGNAIRRLAAATRAYFQGGLIVQGKRGVQVAMSENVLVSGKR